MSVHTAHWLYPNGFWSAGKSGCFQVFIPGGSWEAPSKACQWVMINTSTQKRSLDEQQDWVASAPGATGGGEPGLFMI